LAGRRARVSLLRVKPFTLNVTLTPAVRHGTMSKKRGASAESKKIYAHAKTGGGFQVRELRRILKRRKRRARPP